MIDEGQDGADHKTGASCLLKVVSYQKANHTASLGFCIWMRVTALTA
jgi:hypothetical protein